MIHVLTVFGINDYFWSKILPKMIFGTTILHYVTDYFVKKAPTVIAIVIISCTPCLEKLLILFHIKQKRENSKNRHGKKN